MLLIKPAVKDDKRHYVIRVRLCRIEYCWNISVMRLVSQTYSIFNISLLEGFSSIIRSDLEDNKKKWNLERRMPMDNVTEPNAGERKGHAEGKKARSTISQSERCKIRTGSKQFKGKYITTQKAKYASISRLHISGKYTCGNWENGILL